MVTTMGIKEVSENDLDLLQKLSKQTFKETFGDDNTDEQLEAFFASAYSLENLAKELSEETTEIDFLMLNNQPVGILKCNWGDSQTENVLNEAFEIQRLYVINEAQGQGIGKFAFEYALEKAKSTGFDWAWLGVWEHNYKAQKFYANYGFEKFAEHDFVVSEDKIDTDWLLKKKLK